MENELNKKLNDFIDNDQDYFTVNQFDQNKKKKSSDTKYMDRIILAEDGRQLLSE